MSNILQTKLRRCYAVSSIPRDQQDTKKDSQTIELSDIFQKQNSGAVMLIQELLEVSKILKLQGKLNICIDLCVCASVLVCVGARRIDIHSCKAVWTIIINS